MKAKYFLFVLFSVIIYLVSEAISSCQTGGSNNSYKGKPFRDKLYTGGAQVIPGKLQCEYYDLGGEGVAFHDNDSVNSGSGRLNPADGSYLHEFRMNEAVDISYTKFQDPPIDNTPYNFAEQQKDQLYVGWTKPGEWTKYTVDVKEAGTYQIGIMFTSNKIGKISISVNNADKTGPITIPSTYVAADTVQWRQWHHWNYLDNIASIVLTKGKQTISLHTVETGDMNYDYLNFKLVK
jgi:hypothetical protein